MKLPRDLSGEQLVSSLASLGFARLNQEGSHVTVRHEASGETISIPAHRPLKVGTLAGLLRDVQVITGLSRNEILGKLNR